ncbi:MAG TPA: response regulator transcription factor [Desulfobacterales bacterium]|nr:response regulator transcription factor [Desulfobacterales bacterium]
METTSVVIIDNHPVVRHGISSMLEQRSDMDVVGESEAATSALPVIGYCKPDVVIVDSSMTAFSGVDIIKDIKALSKGTSIIIYSMHQKHEPIYRAFKAGVKGYVLKIDATNDLIDAITEVTHGRMFISQKISSNVRKQLFAGNDGYTEGGLSSLSAREYEIAKLLSQCMRPDEIGEALCISPRTVRVHRSNMMHKLNCERANELLVLLRDYFYH